MKKDLETSILKFKNPCKERKVNTGEAKVNTGEVSFSANKYFEIYKRELRLYGIEKIAEK
jgi:hypothetical protein